MSQFDVTIIGSGPGGYVAAIRCAQLGFKTAIIEKYATLGGTCLNVGCIPSKALLHAVHIIEEAKELKQRGISFSQPIIEPNKLRDWVVNKTINKLTAGLKALAALRKVKVVTGLGEFIDANTVKVSDRQGNLLLQIKFQQVIIATGSRPIKLPNLPEDPRIMDSTGALELNQIPEKLLIIGGGIIGMELGTVYSILGSKVSVVELTGQLLPGVDLDLVKIWQQRLQGKFQEIFLNTKVTTVTPNKNNLAVQFAGEHNGINEYDKILCCVGRSPNTLNLGLEKLGLQLDPKGFITVDKQLRSNISHIFAIGDVVGAPMLAHKAILEAKVAAEVVAGKSSYFDVKVIPNVAYTLPEISWVGLTEQQCKLQNIRYELAAFPWSASGRALAMGRSDGLTKVLFNPVNHQIIGAGIVGENSSELIGELAMAIEMAATAADLSAIIHPHPTTSETIVQAVELFEGSITDLPNPKAYK